ncbi:uncharacterized protein LOC111885198 [Lactuca sativa]|uniref:uncharacterized protein LOC111885198 n=1 Tax=Lactuca sativa TaxID=4236 RepID=UPI000CD80B72|nr:uncharacterized protein LOC111885198 [Lactuca sativa]
MNKEEVSLSKLQGLLRTAKSNLKDKSVASAPTMAAFVLAIGQGKGKKMKAPSKSYQKGKPRDASSFSGTKAGPAKPSSDPKEVECFYFHEKGHWKRSCPKYL